MRVRYPPNGYCLINKCPSSWVHSIILGFRSHPSGLFVPVAVTVSLSFLRSDKPVYSTASIRPLGPCQPTSAMAGPIFSYLRNPNPTFPGRLYDFQLTPLCRGGAPIWGINKSRVPGPVLDRRLHINCLELKVVMAGLLGQLGFSTPGPPGFDRYGQYNSSFLYQQTRRDLFPNLIAFISGSLYVVTSSGYSSQSQAHTIQAVCM